jgi:hypothetical protein
MLINRTSWSVILGGRACRFRSGRAVLFIFVGWQRYRDTDAETRALTDSAGDGYGAAHQNYQRLGDE